MTISVGMVGLGQFGQHFVQLCKAHPDVRRLAICDVRADRVAEMAKRFDIAECYDSLDEICRSDLDALVIITQPWLHFSQVMQALEAGKHVYSAVPTVYGVDGDRLLEQCDALVEKVERTGQNSCTAANAPHEGISASLSMANASIGTISIARSATCVRWRAIDGATSGGRISGAAFRCTILPTRRPAWSR